VWQTKNLSGGTFGVPANAVVEIAVRNSQSATALWGGVRGTGSTLERRFFLHEGEGGGYDLLVMHVQTNANSEIEHYAESAAQLDFVLLGYWTSGTYVEAFSTFKAGGSGGWTDKNLCTYGVRPAGVAEIVITNSDPDDNWDGGVRTNNSSLSRRLDLHEADPSGVDAVSLFVKADTSSNANIEVFAENDAAIDFHIVGYWSVAPLAYTELIADIGSPSSDDSWEDVDLTAFGVINNAIAEIVLANEFVSQEDRMGVRANGGGSLERTLDIHEAECDAGTDCGSDFARMHVLTDATATIEFNHQDVSDPHTFHLVGYWGTCNTSISYVVSDFGVTGGASQASLGHHINSTGKVAGFDEDASGDPDAWYFSCGSLSLLGTLGGSAGEAMGINNSNMVVGWAHDGTGKRKAFTWTSGGGMTNLGTVSGRSDSEAAAVNSSSQVVGTVLTFGIPMTPPRGRLAFIYLPAPAYSLPAGMTSLGTFGGGQSVAMDINDSGQVVGGAMEDNGSVWPFRWENGTMTNLGSLGGESIRIDHRAEAINAGGDVVGRSYTSGGAGRAFFYDSTMTDLGVLTGGTDSWAFGINDSQVVVGTSNVTGGAYRAFVWDSVNGMQNLNNLISAASGWTLIRAMDVANDGSITGWGTNPGGSRRAFLLTPTCNAGGSGATASVIASGSGQSDESGEFEGMVADANGEPLAEITLARSEPGTSIEYQVSRIDPNVADDLGLGEGTIAGFEDAIAVHQTLSVKTSAESSPFQLALQMDVAKHMIEELGVEPGDLEVHVLDRKPSAEAWVPAGANRGASMPSGVVGESGYFTRDDGNLAYWAEVDSDGIFAVGRPVESTDTPADRPLSGMCGIGMVPFLLLASFMLGWRERKKPPADAGRFRSRVGR